MRDYLWNRRERDRETITTMPPPNVREVVMGTDWMSQGKCRDLSPSFFFPSDGIGVQEAQRVCAECPVAEACLQYALDERVDHGVWGGKSERERRRILRRRRLSHAARV
jgi:WhiB family transcriptional regulator, redox-sensing transcriptional regulator